MVLALLATLLGGAWLPSTSFRGKSTYIGLDWFILNLFFTGARLRAAREAVRPTRAAHLPRGLADRSEPLLRESPGCPGLGAAHDGPSGALLPLVVGSSVPACGRGAAPLAAVRRGAGAGGLFAYGSHRLFHAVPLLWRFHAVHHSCECLDWLASSRLHIVDIVVTRAVAFLPCTSWASRRRPSSRTRLRVDPGRPHPRQSPLDFGPLRFLLATPQFHHWHHTAQPEAIDKNFASRWPARRLQASATGNAASTRKSEAPYASPSSRTASSSDAVPRTRAPIASCASMRARWAPRQK